MADYNTQINEAVALLKKKTKATPEIGIILGTGLDALAGEIENPVNVPYADVPHFPSAVVTTHKSHFVFGAVEGKSVVAMAGRFHAYQGYSMHEIALPVWVMARLGIKVLIVSNACGGMREDHTAGDLFVINDQINMLADNPLAGLDDKVFGNLFVDMLDPYDKDLIALTRKIAKEEKVPVKKGVYVALKGPSLETRAEYNWLRIIGADVVGMSTVPEVIVARQNGIRCMGIAVITDKCVPDELEPVDIARIIRTAQEAEPRITRVVKRVIREMSV